MELTILLPPVIISIHHLGFKHLHGTQVVGSQRDDGHLELQLLERLTLEELQFKGSLDDSITRHNPQKI